MKAFLLIIAIIFILGIFASCVVFVSMGISSRKLWEIRNGLEEENGEIMKGGDE